MKPGLFVLWVVIAWPPGVNVNAENLSQLDADATAESQGIHDPTTGYADILQSPDEALGNLPRDRRGKIDWARAIREGYIEPRTDRFGKTENLSFDLDLILTNTKDMPHVIFPHEIHSQWLDCSNCHPAIFVPKAGANPITMNSILTGEHCGVCHGKVAFSPYVCERCHNVLHEGSPQAWW